MATSVPEIEEVEITVAAPAVVLRSSEEKESSKSRGRVQNGERRMDNFVVVGKGGNADPLCINASNPYHQCTENCSRRTTTTRRQLQGVKSVLTVQGGKKSKEGGMVMGGKSVDPTCINASNPYHQCREYCSTRTSELKNQTKGVKSDGGMEGLKMGDNTRVDPRCVNASNPYHKCTADCLQKNQIGRTGGGKSEASRAVAKKVTRKDVNPKCINASNPYHKCAGYCLQRHQEAI